MSHFGWLRSSLLELLPVDCNVLHCAHSDCAQRTMTPAFITRAQMTSLTTFPVCTGVSGIKADAISRYAPLQAHFSCINKWLYIYIERGTWDWSAIELRTVRLVCALVPLSITKSFKILCYSIDVTGCT